MKSGNMTDHELVKVIEQAKKEWEMAFDSIQATIYIVSPDSRIVRSNLAFADFIGLDIHEVVGKKCCDFFPHHHEMGCPAKVKGRRSVEIEFQGPPRRYYQETVHQVMDSKNKVVVVSDITALKLAEIRTEKMARETRVINVRLQASMDELKHTHARLVETEKMASIALLAGRLAHEVNNPLGFISSNIRTLKGYCQDTMRILTVALRQKMTPEIKKMVQEADVDFIRSDYAIAAKEALDGVDRIMLILKAIADFVGAEEVAADVDLGKVVKDLTNSKKLPEGIQMETNLTSVPVFKGLMSSIKLAIGQIVENAVTALQDKGGGTLKISLDTDGDTVVLIITDNGIGMARDTLKRAMDPFYTTKAPGPHIGMGLSIAHAVMSRHNGTLDIESSSKQGTRVTMRFPLSG